MKILSPIAILFITTIATADDCVFDDTSYLEFITQYVETHPQAKLLDDKTTLSIQDNREAILVSGGGCDHLGGKIVATGNTRFNQDELFGKVMTLSTNYASWLIYPGQLKLALKDKSWTFEQGLYRINIDEMTVFEFFQDKGGKIEINFYIN